MQALAVRHLLRHGSELGPGVHRLPHEIEVPLEELMAAMTAWALIEKEREKK